MGSHLSSPRPQKLQKYSKRFGRAAEKRDHLGPTTPQTFDAVYVGAAVMELSGGSHDVLAGGEVDLEGASGTIDFDENGDVNGYFTNQSFDSSCQYVQSGCYLSDGGPCD